MKKDREGEKMISTTTRGAGVEVEGAIIGKGGLNTAPSEKEESHAYSLLEVRRWFISESEKVWVRPVSGGDWVLKDYPEWRGDEYYVVDDELAEYRKGFIDGKVIYRYDDFGCPVRVEKLDEIDFEKSLGDSYDFLGDEWWGKHG